MSTPTHLWLEDENGSPIVGSCIMPKLTLKNGCVVQAVVLDINPGASAPFVLKYSGSSLHIL